ncbi:succinate dehydrogenase assembly factor 2, mitochondrial isoform X2 [Carya illinoinensis]|uniref:succinate dehydrogenase assembly factor 2, mitochondrial isoform X2 n=1 Tax=Carya illinoinensis TaxID=32201 RepID=UPI001C71F714|nr:succinate dehydrogenase assembly factor 2, mitochondrial isoform X2 [Carya illinoinensis]
MGSFRRSLIGVHRILNSNRSSVAVPSSQASFGPRYRGVSDFSSINSNDTLSSDIDLSNEESKRRLFNSLLYRSKQRGFLELDLVLGKWVAEHIHSMDEKGIKALVQVLDLENPDLWKWLTGQERPPESVKTNPVFTAVHDKVLNNLNSHSAPETRATPGQPWDANAPQLCPQALGVGRGTRSVRCGERSSSQGPLE